MSIPRYRPVWASVPTEGESGRPAGQSGCVPFLRRRGDCDQKAEEEPPSFRRGGERRHLPTRWSAWTVGAEMSGRDGEKASRRRHLCVLCVYIHSHKSTNTGCSTHKVQSSR